MPYIQQYVEPELALEHKGVKVWHTYEADDFNQGAATYFFTVDPEQTDFEDFEGSVVFDVRDLPTWKEPEHPPYIESLTDTPDEKAAKSAAWDNWHADKVEAKAILQTIRDAIDQGLLKAPKLEEIKEG